MRLVGLVFMFRDNVVLSLRAGTAVSEVDKRLASFR